MVRLVQGCGVTSLEVVPNGSSMTFSCVSSCLGAAPRRGVAAEPEGLPAAVCPFT